MDRENCIPCGTVDRTNEVHLNHEHGADDDWIRSRRHSAKLMFIFPFY